MSWIGRDGRLIIAARTLRSFAQTSVMLVIAIYLALRGFSLVEIGLVLSLGSVGAATSAVVIGLVGDTWGRRRALVVLGVLMSLTGIVLATSDALVVLAAALWTATSATVPFVAGATVKIAYDLALWRLFRSVKPPEEATVPERVSTPAPVP